jgi:hypothetical protein
MSGTKSQEFEVGRQVGIIEGRVREQERIIAMIENLQLSTLNPETQESQLIEMDWGSLFEEIRGGEEN